LYPGPQSLTLPDAPPRVDARQFRADLDAVIDQRIDD
jgi:hypothetical protein